MRTSDHTYINCLIIWTVYYPGCLAKYSDVLEASHSSDFESLLKHIKDIVNTTCILKHGVSYCTAHEQNIILFGTYALMNDPSNFKIHCHIVHHVNSARLRSLFIKTRLKA
jgi:hypothetical protein